MLSNRQKLILKAIVEEYVKTNEPVGSKTISTWENFNFSPATLRNDMAELEEMGYLEKTHTSSGRIPSVKGYHFYVEEVLKKKNDDYSFPMVDEIFRRNDLSREQAIKESMNLVSQLTNYASVVLGNAASSERIKKIQFVGLQGHYALILLITDSGHVESKKIIVPYELSMHEVEKVVNVLDEVLHNAYVGSISTDVLKQIKNEDIKEFLAYREDLVKAIIASFQEMNKNKFIFQGQTNFLHQPEFQDIDKIRELFDAIETKEILKVIDYDNDGITVRIGSENELKALRDCTVITVPYTSKNGDKGAISILGPTRMEYSKIIPLLEYIVKNINRIL